MKSSVCPICKGTREPFSKNPAYPFCSRRCKLADLSNWFSESYSVPGEIGPGDEEPNSDDPSILH